MCNDLVEEISIKKSCLRSIIFVDTMQNQIYKGVNTPHTFPLSFRAITQARDQSTEAVKKPRDHFYDFTEQEQIDMERLITLLRREQDHFLCC